MGSDALVEQGSRSLLDFEGGIEGRHLRSVNMSRTDSSLGKDMRVTPIDV